MSDHQIIREEAKTALLELLGQAKLEEGSLLVIGCSTSEVLGNKIGKGSSPEVAQALVETILPELRRRKIWLAAQCCEHLNRAVILEKEAARQFGYEIVSVVPQPHAGGSWATACWQAFDCPVAVEEVRADAGIDIGDTLIGMHLKRVAVPVRVSIKKIGEANLVCARTRPKFIGGSRAVYSLEEVR